MSTGKMRDDFHRESDEGVDAVLNRMLDAVGGHAGGMAAALDVSPETIKTWRRRGEVSMRFLQGFAEEHGLSLDMLRYGENRHPSSGGVGSEFELSPREIALLRNYRRADAEARLALEQVASALARSSAPPKRESYEGSKQVFKAQVGDVAGRDINKR